ncbi:tetratricopeptide repeat protein [bacterium]|nr:tetratricopeptide repeat protein [bacterium]
MNDKIKNKIFIYSLLLLTAISAVLMFHKLGDRSICGDEMEHRRMAQQPVLRIMQGWRVQAEPLAHLIKHFSLKINDGPINLRILGAGGAIFMVFLTGLLTGKLAGRWAGLTAAFLVMLCPGLMKWGQYDRFYTFGTASILLSTLLFFYALEKDTWKAWIWYGLSALFQIQLWYFGMVHIAICAGIYGIIWLIAWLPIRDKMIYRPDKWHSFLKAGVIIGSIGIFLIIQYFTFNDKILGVVLNPTDNDKLVRYGPSAFSWETFGFVFQMYLPAYVHIKWLLIVGFFAALFIDRERSLIFTIIAIGSTFIIVWGLDKNKATLSENRMLFTVPFWAFFMARGAWLITDIFWRGGLWFLKKFPANKQKIKAVQRSGAIAGAVIAMYLIMPLQLKAWNAFKRYYQVDFTYCRNIGDFLSANVGTNDSVYYEWSMEGLPIKYYFDKQRGTNPVMHVCKDINKGGFNITSEDIKLLKDGQNRMWLLPNWRPQQNTLPVALRNWLRNRSITLAIEHPWVPWSGPQKIIIADKNYEKMNSHQREMEKIKWLKKFVELGKYYNDAGAEVLKLLSKNKLTNEFSAYLKYIANRYPDEPELSEKIAAMKLNDKDLIFAGGAFPSCGKLHARLGKMYINQSNYIRAAQCYIFALKNSPEEIFDGNELRKLLKQNANGMLRKAVLNNIKNKKTTVKLSPAELFEWANCAPELLNQEWLIYPTKDELRYLKWAISKKTDKNDLKERIKQYSFTELWEYTDVANAFSHAKEWDLAVEWLARSVNSEFKDWLLAKRLTELYQIRNKPEEKQASIDACLKFQQWLPENDLTNRSVAAYKLGILYLSENKNDDAVSLFKETAELSEKCAYHPLHFRAWIQLGHIARKAGRNDDAINAYEEVLKLEPEHKSTIEVLANLYEAKGDKERSSELRKKLTK